MALPRRLLTRLAIAVVAAIALLYGGVLLYTQVLNDAPDALDIADLDAALDATTTSSAPASTAPAATTAPTTSAVLDAPIESAGRWVITEGSQVGYRVAEVLFGVNTEGVGRTDQVTGGIVVDAETLTDAEFVVDVASMTSDDGRRDNQFRGRIMDTATYPTASFVLTEAVELGVSAADGTEVSIEANGELTMHGVTQPVTVAITARVDGDRIGILGSIPVVFTDFDIIDPSITGITVEPEGLVEFVLVLAPAD